MKPSRPNNGEFLAGWPPGVGKPSQTELLRWIEHAAQVALAEESRREAAFLEIHHFAAWGYYYQTEGKRDACHVPA